MHLVSAKVATRLVAEVGNTLEDVETEAVDPKDFIFLGDGNDRKGKDSRYTAITDWADGFLLFRLNTTIVSPAH